MAKLAIKAGKPITYWNRDHQAVCRAGLKKGVYERYLQRSNLENLNVSEDTAIEASTYVMYILYFV